MSLDSENKYTIMQRSIYESGAKHWKLSEKDHVVGSFDAHNDHLDYEELFKGFDTADKVMLDFGCGPGRNIVKYHDRFARIDGADIASINLEKARIWMEHNGIDPSTVNLYLVNGIELDTVPSDTYDFVMSTITLQHIAVYDIRLSILTDMFRVLKSGGWITLQMGYGCDKHDAVEYHENNYDANTTNGSMDTRVTDPLQLLTDLTQIGYTNFNHTICPPGPGDNHSNWIFFRAQKP